MCMWSVLMLLRATQAAHWLRSFCAAKLSGLPLQQSAPLDDIAGVLVYIPPHGLHRIQQLHKHYTGYLFTLCNSLWHNRVLTECTWLVDSMADAFLYFGYGSNLLMQRLQLLNPSAEFVTIGKLKVSTVCLVKHVHAFLMRYLAVVLLPIPNDPGNALAHIL